MADMTLTLSEGAAKLISEHGYSYSVRTRTPKETLLSAQRDFEAAQRLTPGVTQAEVNDDLQSFELLAMRSVRLARDGIRFTKSSWNPSESLSDIARQIGDVLASGLGLSREAACVLDAQILVEGCDG